MLETRERDSPAAMAPATPVPAPLTLVWRELDASITASAERAKASLAARVLDAHDVIDEIITDVKASLAISARRRS
jgi:hypothetical protein